MGDMRSRRFLTACGLSVATLLTGAGTTVAVAAPAAPYCGITWGSLPETSGPMTQAPVTGVRVGRHDCWDRLVIDLAGTPAPGFDVRYTDGFTDAYPGDSLPVAGGAVLTVKVVAPSYGEMGRPTVFWGEGASVADVGRFGTFRDVVFGGGSGETGDCDAHPIAVGTHHAGFFCDDGRPVNWLPISKFGLGVRARLPFRVFTLDGPGAGSRLVIDVAHRW